jgi:hypothetical protein
MAGSFPANRPIIMDIVREVNPKSLIDLGVGSGFYGEMIRRDFPDILLHGVEAFDYANYRWDMYDKIIREDVRSVKLDKYDLYLMVDIIEHMSKEEGHLVLSKLDGPVLVSTPWNYDQGPDRNPLQEHVSRWTLEDFKNYRYKNYSNYLSAIILLEV